MKTIIIDGIEYNLTPKARFKKGDWITNGDYTWRIVEVKPLDYILQSQDGNTVDDTISHVDEQFHSFTIEDAKDGDVLAAYECYVIFKEIDGLNIKCYCTYHYMGSNPRLYVDTLQNKNAFHPATKEQRDLLFQKMKEAGYEWDAEKKELKKSESYSLRSIIKDEPSPAIKKVVDSLTAWSEEDEVALGDALWCCKQAASIAKDENDMGNVWYAERWLNSLKDRVQPQPQQEWSKEDERMYNRIVSFIPQHLTAESYTACISWLKSLRPQSTWKPSDEQMKALKEACDEHWEPDGLDPLYMLWEQLKKLREE